MKLTQKTVDGLVLPPGKAEVIFFDEEIPGYGCRLRTGGSRRAIFQYKLGNKQRRMALGPPTGRTREAAKSLYAKVRLGHDPAGEKLEGRVRAAETMGAVVEAYLPHVKARQRPRTYTDTERHLKAYCKPLRGLRLTAVDRRVIAVTLNEIASKSGVVTSNRVRTSLSAFFAWTLRQGLLEANPVIGTGRMPEASRDRVLSDVELKAIWSALENNDYGAVIRLLVLTGQRAGEIARLRWAEVGETEILLPAARTKNNRAHTVPLSEAVRGILQLREDRTCVFGRDDTGFSGWSTSKRALDERLRAAGHSLPHWMPHDIRRSVATGMSNLGVQPHVVEAILNHVSGSKAGVAGVYNRSRYEVEKRLTLSLWAEHVLALVEERDNESAQSKIVALK
jgi:integrase